ncbi:MAG: hypothetical protein IJU54_00895 [Alphaproteobacteria bacterium]|nr:hypothetical protein [Alphaproteobacteria bacterium]
MKLLYIIGLTIFISNYCSAATNNHNNKYDPNIIYTSTQYMIDHDIELLQDEKKLMQFYKTINNAKSQTSILLGYEINGQTSKKLKTNNILNISDFREIIDPIIQRNIGNLPKNALEVQNINKSLTKFTLEALLNIVVQNKIKDSNKSENKCNIKCNNNINDSNSVNKNTVQDNNNMNDNSANNSNDINNTNSMNNMNAKNNSNINNQNIANNSNDKNKNSVNNDSNVKNNNLNNKDKVNNNHTVNITNNVNTKNTIKYNNTNNKTNNISNTNNLLDKCDTSNKNTVKNNDNSVNNHNASNKKNNANNKNNMQNNNNVINITNCNLLLLDNETNYINSIFGKNYNNDIQELGIIKYKNKKCTFNIVAEQNEFYLNVNLS